MTRKKKDKRQEESQQQKRYYGIALILLVTIFQSLYHYIIPFLDSFFDLPAVVIPSRRQYDYIPPPNPNITTIYCPGAGFSGFWYLFGKLKACQQEGMLVSESTGEMPTNPVIRNPHYFCFSAGCLGVAAALFEKSFAEVFNAAINARELWIHGEITRYDIVPSFIDHILEFEDRKEGLRKVIYTNTTSCDYNDTIVQNDHFSLLEKLEKIHIITTASDNNTILGLKYVFKTPKNFEDLKEMLIQTTWIPFVTGNTIWRETGDMLNMDGAFTANIHPKFDVNLRLPLRRDLVLNALNPNMDPNKAELFFNLGFSSIAQKCD